MGAKVCFISLRFLSDTSEAVPDAGATLCVAGEETLDGFDLGVTRPGLHSSLAFGKLHLSAPVFLAAKQLELVRWFWRATSILDMLRLQEYYFFPSWLHSLLAGAQKTFSFTGPFSQPLLTEKKVLRE